jgi:hypothetical protein
VSPLIVPLRELYPQFAHPRRTGVGRYTPHIIWHHGANRAYVSLLTTHANIINTHFLHAIAQRARASQLKCLHDHIASTALHRVQQYIQRGKGAKKSTKSLVVTSSNATYLSFLNGNLVAEQTGWRCTHMTRVIAEDLHRAQARIQWNKWANKATTQLIWTYYNDTYLNWQFGISVAEQAWVPIWNLFCNLNLGQHKHMLLN